jgi:hypothetical protein
MDVDERVFSSAMDESMARISRAAQMMVYGGDEDRYPDSPYSSNGSVSTLPDRSNMDYQEIADLTGDIITEMVEHVRQADLAELSQTKLSRLMTVVNYQRDVGFNNAQMSLLRRERPLAEAVMRILFDEPTLAAYHENDQLRAAQVLVPLLGISSFDVLDFVIKTWGRQPPIQRDYIFDEYRSLRNFKMGDAYGLNAPPIRQRRTVKATFSHCADLDADVLLTRNLLNRWIPMAMPDALFQNTADRNDLMSSLARGFASLEGFEGIPLCLSMMLERLDRHQLYRNERTDESLLLFLAQRSVEDMVAITSMYPVLLTLYPDLARDWRDLSFDAKQALKISIVSGANDQAVARIAKRAKKFGTLDGGRQKEISAYDVKRLIIPLALFHGRSDLLEMTDYIIYLKTEHGIPAYQTPVPLEVVKAAMFGARPSVWRWIYVNSGYGGNNVRGFDTARYDVDRVIRASNNHWVDVAE